jgi:hypothetical protein
MGLGIFITVNKEINQSLTDQVSTVEVYEKIDEPTTYKIRFMVDICNDDIAQSLESMTDPGCILGVLVEANDQMSCLVNGPVIQQQANLEDGGSGSWLDVQGIDTSKLMDEKPDPKSRTGTDSEIVSAILKPAYVEELDVENTPDSKHTEDTHTQAQKETNLGMVKRLAQRNGFHFWITYDTKGRATGHFRPRKLQGKPANELRVNADVTNIDNLQIKWDLNRPAEVTGSQVDPTNKKIFGGTVNLKDAETLGASGLPKLFGNAPVSTQIAPPTDNAGALERRKKALLAESQWFISATCKTTTDKLCGLLRYHTLVSVQGLGTRHSGNYYITAVRHSIDPSAHTMDVEMARNAWGSQAAGSGLTSTIF